MSDKIRKLSQAMRLGCLIKPRQVFNRTFDKEDGACAIGAVSACFPDDFGNNIRLGNRFPGFRNLRCEIIFRNDGLRQSREEIADWLEKIGF